MGYRGIKEYAGLSKEVMKALTDSSILLTSVAGGGWSHLKRKEERRLGEHFAKITIDLLKYREATDPKEKRTWKNLATYHQKDLVKLLKSYERNKK